MFITSNDQITKGTFLLVDWDMKLQQTMVEMFPLNSADAAYTKISGMLSTLGDPFTRIISPKVLQITFLFLKSHLLSFLGRSIEKVVT